MPPSAQSHLVGNIGTVPLNELQLITGHLHARFGMLPKALHYNLSTNRFPGVPRRRKTVLRETFLLFISTYKSCTEVFLQIRRRIRSCSSAGIGAKIDFEVLVVRRLNYYWHSFANLWITLSYIIATYQQMRFTNITSICLLLDGRQNRNDLPLCKLPYSSITFDFLCKPEPLLITFQSKYVKLNS